MSLEGVTWSDAEVAAAARELLRTLPSLRLRVSGACMEPAIREGATVTLEARRPRFGDVVLAWQREGLRLHRLVWAPRLRAAAWRTQADRAGLFDGRLRREDVIATVRSVEGSDAPPRRIGRALVSLLRSLWRLAESASR